MKHPNKRKYVTALDPARMRGRPRKVPAEGVAEIRHWHAARLTLQRPCDIRRKFNISSASLSAICRGVVYKRQFPVTPEQIQRIIDENTRLRDKLLELAKECAECNGTGLVTLSQTLEAVDAGSAGDVQQQCPGCADIREVLGQ